jgi:tRNA pseudouridine55 synthase
VVAVVRSWLGLKAVGHAGTLDPMATGLLIILLGKSTRLSEYLKAYDKTYTGTITLGVATDTYDAEGKVTLQQPCSVTPEQVKEVATTFVPGYEQTPPPYAALKIKGQAAYRLARQGRQVKLKPRAVKFMSLKLN